MDVGDSTASVKGKWEMGSYRAAFRKTEMCKGKMMIYPMFACLLGLRCSWSYPEQGALLLYCVGAGVI